MEKVFVVADIHGHYGKLEKLLTCWRPEEEQLIFLGDYIDRGQESLAVLQKVKLLTEQGAIALTGNHEQLFLRWLTDPDWAHYLGNNIGGMATLTSLQRPEWRANTNEEIAQGIIKHYADLLQWIKALPLFYQWNQYFFVHGGVDPEQEDATQTEPRDLIWIREKFHHTPHKAKETVVFGHTPTPYLNESGTGELWISPCGKKIGLDGGVVMQGGQFNGLVLTKGSDEITVYSVVEEQIKTVTKKLAK
ncbi:metallophosphoesterase family protein [Metasolibacillus meyeri]|uniref:metallophosphoesterase family protein n=1 Tax=Metasolibacillus meyeri TaxID=1071052 RepID=UPI00187D2C97|nr:metallophosphoesterase family protein [Metasolibacillus meyeri]